MRRMVCLDGLRGVLACYVMLSHTVPFAPLPHWLHWLFQHGGAGVDVFFILSGLVIVQSLDSFGYRAKPFLIARVARIYPVFLVVFALAVMVQPIATGFERMAWIGPDNPARFIWSGGWPSAWGVFVVTHLTMTHGLFPNGVLPDLWVGFLGAAWSLSTEWQFYVLALLVGVRLGSIRMAWLFLAMAAVAVAWQASVPEGWQFSRAFLPNKAQYFALGIVSAVVMRGGWKAYWPVLAATLLACGVQGGIDKLLPPLVWTVCLAAQYVSSTPSAKKQDAATFAYTTDVGALSRRLRLERGQVLRLVALVLESRPLVWLGAVSYCIYLVNEPVQKLLGVSLSLLVGGNVTLFTVLWLPGATVLPLLAAWWLHEWIELPAQRYGRGIALATVNVQ
jgi:peptidoglycan/LPS O-acetylase OafA/YrhL